MSFRNYYETSSYGRNRDIGRNASTSTERAATVTAKYTTTPSYKSSSIPIVNDRSAREETPISAIANRYASYSKTATEKASPKYEKKDYSLKLSVPTINTNKSRDVSPVSTTSKYCLSRTSRHSSPDRRTIKTFKEKRHDSPVERDKDIPNKTDKTSNYSGVSNYKLYPRASSYTRPSPRSEVKPEVNVNRYAIGNRLSTSSYLRSPTPIKRPSVSPVNVIDINKTENLKTSLSNVVVEEDSQKEVVNDECLLNGSDLVIEPNEGIETVTVVTRHTSPTPPGSSTYVRMRRADMAKTIEKIISRPKKRPPLVDKEMQSDRLDDPTRSSRFGSTSRTSMTNWTYYSPNVNSYTGYAGRYSTQYSNLRESNANSYDRSSRSRSKEPIENKILGSQTEHEKVNDGKTSSDATEFEEKNNENKNEDTSEIIINVNLTLKQTRSSSAVSSSELISPEITITNSHQLPPQPPKSENSNKLKKSKVRKSSTDSSSDSSSKKVVKKRTKSASSTGSEQSTEKLQKSKVSKNINNTKTSSDLQKGPLKLKYSKCRENNSPETSVTLSTQSSISEDENTSKSNIKDSIRNSKGEISLSQTEQMLKQLPQNKNEGTEDAKSFLIRALAPVTNLFKLRHQDNTECGRKENSDADFKESVNIKNENSKSKNNTKNIIVSNEDEFVTLKGIRHVESGERSRWLESDFENKSCNVEQDRNQENYSENKISDSNNFKRTLKSNCFPDDEKPWWLDSSANIPEGIERLTPPRKSSSDSDKSEKFYHFKIRQIDSGEIKDWWSNSDQTTSSNKQELPNGIKLSKSGSDQKTFPIKRIRHVESGERPWWLSSEKNIPEGIEKLPTPPPQEDSDSSDSDEVQVYIPPSQMPPFPLHIPDDEPLGARRSPEGLETPKESEDYRLGRSSSPYENSRIFRRGISNIPYQKGSEKYISRYTDIDDILGTSGQIYSPFMDSILARRTGQVSFDDDECQEIDPTQVRIHDSTAQMPVIKKLRCRSEIIDYRVEDQLDDATLQVFKDGDYGPYLDLDSTLGEQDEELEGLQESRKNSLVLRTQLSVRVHAIIERLLHSQGRELRRALFTLKQILQSDKDLVHEFVANKGLDCLMQVANMADHNYLDYILRALGQILLYVDGMHGVMNHKRCIQWLYSLISSKLRHVVKTALKLLLVFVEYTEKNCLLFIEAIVAVDTSNARQPWYNVMKILQDFDASDTELLIYVTTLINRCLNNIPDRDLYYDQVDSLQDQGIDDIIQLYMSKQGTDLDLLRQLQIFEAVLLYEDGDETGTALKQLDESVITSLRKRSHNLSTTTRRKSKKQEEREKGNQRFTTGLKQRIQNGTLGHSVNTADSLVAMRQKQIDVNPEPKDDREILLNREHSIKDIAQRLTSPLNSATDEKPIRVSDMAGIVSKAKEELAKSKSKEIIKSPTIEKSPKVHEIKVSENDLHWEELKKGCLNREFHLCDLDFSDLRHDSDDEMECHQLQRVCASNGPPPPPPSMLPPMNLPPPPPTNFPTLPKNTSNPPTETDSANSTLKKNKKTVKLFWREIQEVPVPAPVKTKIGGSIWDDLPQVALDTNMLEHLFESRSNDLIIKVSKNIY
ncbi:uncharacterized protein LOC116777095 isoform X1 [Danaus plexippus]|uniref:uncharacterized protein LOC116777095 isoform X1 n=1 Tax=Danaus plexippus TaxID=13037 RepID=UPI002AAF1663|nr:uncharacterized protein LOC116777095 isoform X1 [Danaus plexippus]